MREAVALRLGSAQEMRRFTVSDLNAAVTIALEMKGGDKRKSRHSGLLGDYYLALDEIRKRSNRDVNLEKTNQESSKCNQ